MKKIGMFLLILGIGNAAQAGFNGLTFHSRANCINNESITWDWTTYRVSETVSQHYRYGNWVHGIATGWENTWRSAAVHWNEAAPRSGWRVIGYHWLKINGQERMIAQTDTEDCSIYDGWWDENKNFNWGHLEMKKTLLAISMLSFSALSHAQTEYTNRSEFLKAVPQIIEGVQIVPSSGMTINDSAIIKKQMQTQGYIESDTPNPRGLMQVKERAPSMKSNKDSDPNNYYLRKELSEIKLSFAYKEVSDPAKLIGFAPAGKHLAQGWTGIKEFFEDSNLGVCSLTTFQIKDTQMGIRINSDLVSYAVKQNPTTIEVEGSKQSGFIYTVSWVDNTFSKDFECAKMTFDKNQTKKMVTLANNM